MSLFSLAYYLLSHILLSLALGTLTTKFRFLAIPKASLFFAGVAVTPFTYSMISLLLLCVPVQLPALVYTLVPVVFSFVILLTNRGLFREIPALFRLVSPATRVVALISCILFPLISVSPDIAFYIRHIFHPVFMLVVSLACGVAIALVILLSYRNTLLQSFKPNKRAVLFLVSALALTVSIYMIFLADHRQIPSQNFVWFIAAIIVVCALSFSLVPLFKRCFGFSPSLAKTIAVYFGLISTAIIIIRLGSHYIRNVISGTNPQIVIISLFLLFVAALVCLALDLFNRTVMKSPDKSAPKASFHSSIRSFAQNVILVFSIVTLLVSIMTITTSIPAPVAGSDALEYMTSASEIANTRTFASINTYNGSVSGSQIGVVHHPAWIAYLAQALMHGSSQPFGYPNDLASRAAFPLTYVYLLLAVYALARAFLPKRYSLFATALAACTPQLGYLIALNSREGFRIIPILLLILVLYGYSQAVSKERRVLWPELLMVLFVASCVMMGHVINAIPAAAIGVSILLFLLITRNLNWQTVLMGISAAFGGILGCIQIPLGYLEHGKLLSDIISLDTMLAGTPYLKNFEIYQQSRLGDTRTYLDRLNVLVRYDHGLLTAVGVAFGILFVVLLILAVRKRKPAPITGLIGLTGIFFALLFTDLFSWSGYTLSEWSIMNVRYLSHLYPLYAVLVAGGLYLFGHVKIKRVFVSLGISVLLCCYAVYTSAQISCTFPFEDQVERNLPVAEAYTAAYRNHEQHEGRMLIDNYYCNYYLNCEALTIFSDAANDIRRAPTLMELTTALEKENIDAIMITYEFVPIYWADTVLFQLANSSQYQATDYGFFCIYQRVS